jgi:hypothetical protein
VAELVVLPQILLAEGNAEHPLFDQDGSLSLGEVPGPCVARAADEAPDQVDGPVRSAEQQRAGVGVIALPSK